MADVAFFRRLASVAAEQTLPRFRKGTDIANKLAAGFDPVTEADREAERVIRAEIEASFPAHGILGEEHGTKSGDGRHLWVIDPIDGTRAFISGLPVWGTLVALLDEGDAIAGMMSQPFTGELYYADEKGSFYEGPGGNRQLATSKVEKLSEATMFTTTPALFFGEDRTRYDRLEQAARLARYGTDCYAFAMVAAGHADLVIESGLQTYDIAALIPIIEKAGGVVTTWDGRPAENGGNILASANQTLHQAALELFNA